MDALNSLFMQYSIESIILFVILLAISVKITHELWDYFKGKAREAFKKEETQGQLEINFNEKFQELTDKLDALDGRLDTIDHNFEGIKTRLSLIEERQQEDTRSFLIDTHHKFCYEVKAIDDISLQSIERKYMYYKNAGGNSFIDGLVQEIRQLPRINTSTIRGYDNA